jgi:acyl-coenzyme A thioesterase PaaI-like protein
MDATAMKAFLASLPFNRHLGIDIVEVGPGTGHGRLPEADELKNHVGTQHAGALFTVGEATSGAAIAGLVAASGGALVPLAKSARIDYLKPASGPIDAKATLRGDAAALLAAAPTADRLEAEVEVALADARGVGVALVVVEWVLRRPRA